MVFSANVRVSIKLLIQQKKYGAEKFIAEFSSKPWTLSGLNNGCLILDTLCFEATS